MKAAAEPKEKKLHWFFFHPDASREEPVNGRRQTPFGEIAVRNNVVRTDNQEIAEWLRAHGWPTGPEEMR